MTLEYVFFNYLLLNLGNVHYKYVTVKIVYVSKNSMNVV